MTTAAPPVRPQRPPLLRPRDCVLGGVSVALARHLGWSVAATRWILVGLSFAGGAGILFYAWLWATVAVDPLPVPSGPDADAPAAASATTPVRHRVPLRWLVLGAAVIAAVLELALWSASGGVVVLLLFALTVVVAAAALFGPWAVRLWHELIDERTARVREEQRAEMAAHLHDSVLQTLALIQNRAGASSEVARIARAQERELRQWLYSGTGSADADLATDLQDLASALELDYPVRIEVVAVGEAAERSSGELAAAAREAMLNAARRAGGEVSVYIESTASTVDVFVRDRGPGFDARAVPEDRLGVRESIVGRMRRAGGSADVGPGAGGAGTQVHLHVDRERREEP